MKSALLMIMKILLLLIIVFTLVPSCRSYDMTFRNNDMTFQNNDTDTGDVRAFAWKSRTQIPESTDFPELKISSVNQRPNTAILFSGGGSRSFIASIGYLAALTKLDLIKNIRYKLSPTSILAAV
jgi:hypothetical protein